MSPELRGPGEHTHNEILFPADSLARFIELPERLSSWFKESDTAKITEIHTNNLAVMANQLATAYNRTNHIRRPRAHHTWFDEQAIARQDILADTASREGTYIDGIGSVRVATRAQCAAEYTYLAYTMKAGIEIDDEVLSTAGSMSRTMKPLFGIMQRIKRGGVPIEETPEGLNQLEENIDTYRDLLLFENHVHASMVLESCLALGNKRDVRATLTLYKKMRDISCNEHMGTAEKLTVQAKIISSVAQIADRVGFGQANPPLSDYMRQQTDNMNTLAASNLHESDIFSLVIRGRQHRLDKSQKPASQANEQDATSPLLAGTVSIQPIETPEKPQPSPNYVEQLQTILASLDLHQPVLLGGKEIRRRGLDAARAMFIRGAVDGAGNEIIAGRSAFDTQKLLSDIEFVLSCVPNNGNLATAHKALKTAAHDSAEANRAIRDLLSKAGQDLRTADVMELSQRAPAIRNVGSLIRCLRKDWPTISYVIDKTWPSSRKPTMLLQLEELLFPEDDAELPKEAQA